MSKQNLPVRIAKLHNLFAHLGKPGRKLVNLLAYYSLYVIFTNGGVEALAVICHEYMLTKVKEQQIHDRTHGNTSGPASAQDQKMSRLR